MAFDNTYIPRRLDDQWKLGFWDIDVAAPVVFGVFLGYLTGTKMGMALCSVVGFYLGRAMGRLKADKHPAFTLHWIYWHFPTTPVTKLNETPPSGIGRMVG